jgi:hypothetical protein
MLDILLRSARLSGMLALGLFLLMPIASARAAATAVNACQTLSAPGNYLVTSNLTASGDCFTLTVSNIAIDMQGHKIVGNGSGAAITDGGNSIRYIIVANGKISNFAKGIDLSSDSGQTADLILNVNVSGNTGDGINIRGRDNSLTSVIANNNGGNGIVQGNCCNSIFNVETNGNAGDGINLSSEDYLKNVTSNGNGGNGVIGSSDSFVALSIANQNAGNGIELQNGNNFVVLSIANGNSGNGILLSQYDMATDSKAGKNLGDGIKFQDEFGLATSVVTNNNVGDGVFLTCAGNAVRVSAKGNSGTNLHEDLTDGICTNVRNKAP